MKTIRGCFVIIFSLCGLHSLAERLDPVSDEAVVVDAADITPEAIELLRWEVKIRKEMGEDTRSLESKIKAAEAQAGENGFGR